MKIWEIGLAVLVAFIWGFSFVMIQIGIDIFPPLLFSALRFTLAAIPLVLFVSPPNVSWKLVVAIGLTLGVVKFSFLFIGMDVGLSAGLASLLLQSQVFFTLILAAIVLNDAPSRNQWVGTLIAFCGVAVVVSTVEASSTIFGIILVLGAAVAWAINNLLMHGAGTIRMFNLMVWISLVPPIPLFILSWLFESSEWPQISQITWQGIGALVYVTLVGTVLGFAAWGYLLSRHGAGPVSSFALLVPVFGMSSSAVIFEEAFGPVRLTGAMLVLFGLVLTLLKRTESRDDADIDGEQPPISEKNSGK